MQGLIMHIVYKCRIYDCLLVYHLYYLYVGIVNV